MDMTRVQFLSASDEINKRPDEYWSLVMDIARRNNLKRIVRYLLQPPRPIACTWWLAACSGQLSVQSPAASCPMLAAALCMAHSLAQLCWYYA